MLAEKVERREQYGQSEFYYSKEKNTKEFFTIVWVACVLCVCGGVVVCVEQNGGC